MHTFVVCSEVPKPTQHHAAHRCAHASTKVTKVVLKCIPKSFEIRPMNQNWYEKELKTAPRTYKWSSNDRKDRPCEPTEAQRGARESPDSSQKPIRSGRSSRLAHKGTVENILWASRVPSLPWRRPWPIQGCPKGDPKEPRCLQEDPKMAQRRSKKSQKGRQEESEDAKMQRWSSRKVSKNH